MMYRLTIRLEPFNRLAASTSPDVEVSKVVTSAGQARDLLAVALKAADLEEYQ